MSNNETDARLVAARRLFHLNIKIQATKMPREELEEAFLAQVMASYDRQLEEAAAASTEAPIEDNSHT
jgi:hypothetical protein